MLDDHKYSVRRIVAYNHASPRHPAALYGPGGPARTYGVVTEVHLVEEPRHWEYTVRNLFIQEECRVPEGQIFHGADQGYLDLHRRDDIRWFHGLPEAARNNLKSPFWRTSLKQFVRTAIPRIRKREQEEEKARTEGRSLNLGPGDYVRVRGDLRPEMEPYRNLYAKVLAVSPADREDMDVPGGRHKILTSYHILLDTGDEADIYDVEVKTIYTTGGRTVILNWRAATFLAEAFGDDPPYDLRLEYLNGHVFTRTELVDMAADDLADLLARLLYAKGLITWEELPEKTERFSKSPPEYLVDQILAHSRFDMKQNRSLTDTEILQSRSEDDRLRELLG
ncbi:MAG TPA: hypothetical protein VMX94_12630 [Armatimonadota bacterium]|nr:hypothetical protein [Armatimonadota bacterium]